MAIFTIFFSIVSVVSFLVTLPFIVVGFTELISVIPYIIAAIIVLSAIGFVVYLLNFASSAITQQFPAITKLAVSLTKNLWLSFVVLPLVGAVAIFLLALLISPFVFIVTSTDNPLLTLSLFGVFLFGCSYFAYKEYQNS
ncbi:Uncharacterised protein [Canicola haemoglobinophilus]|uniref:Uncharacterized protein n=1 Tax=Canicola haemoglobinophilus TaxID=733 RepID=A0AB38HB86_9PAST|nr:hypothetical protein [Canicola haemoglobinophilus]STO54360.1 Uncharacterised protein [Canicola haemoglobinophilus]STO68894.1 Uncharacterised protein [Canicola haemoglobinophilus]